MRDSERYYQFKRQMETIDKEIAYNGRQLKKLHSIFTRAFPDNFKRHGWWLNLQKCGGKKAKTCRNCPHNLVWIFYQYIPVSKINTSKVKVADGRQLYKKLWDGNSRSEKLPWDYFITVRGEKVNVGFRRRSKEMRTLARHAQKIRDKIMARRKSLIELRRIIEGRMSALLARSDEYKKNLRADFEELTTLLGSTEGIKGRMFRTASFSSFVISQKRKDSNAEGLLKYISFDFLYLRKIFRGLYFVSYFRCLSKIIPRDLTTQVCEKFQQL